MLETHKDRDGKRKTRGGERERTSKTKKIVGRLLELSKKEA